MNTETKVIYIVGMIALIAAIIITPASAEFEPGECDIYVHDGESIHSAIRDLASPGDTVCVYNGSYFVFYIEKPNITVKGEGADVVTINGRDSQSIEIWDPGAVVEGFTVVDSPSGVYVSAPDCIIRDCIFNDVWGSMRLCADNITFENNVVTGGTSDNCAIDMSYSNAIFRNNVVSNPSGYAIVLSGPLDWTCANNVFTGNTIITDNKYAFGLELYSDDVDNKVYLNNIINSSIDIYKLDAPFHWNSTEPIEYVYNGTTYTNYLGNYWSDYTGKDADGDGIGDIPYHKKTRRYADGYPLMERFENYPAPSKVDLTTTALTAHPYPLIMNQTSTITATIANVGTADAGSFNVSLSVNGSVVNSTSITSLSAGTSTNVSFSWTPTSAGDYELCVVADADSEIEESDETNNAKCISVSVNAPDLTTTSIDVPSLFANQTNTITATIANIGTADAGSFNAALSANGEVVDTVRVQSLGAGASKDLSFSWKPASTGEYVLCVSADSEKEIDELNETNNKKCITATVSEIPAEVAWYYGANIPWSAKRLSNGNTLITEFGNHRVLEVTPAGDIVWHYGTEGLAGSGPDELDSPVDAERLENGNTLITDSKNHRVIEVDSNKNIVWQYGNGTPGAGINQLNYPMDAERLENGNTLITDEHNCRIIEVRTSDYDNTKPNNGFTADSIVWQYGTTGVSGSGANELNYPKDADRLANGNTLIADYRNHRVVEVNATGGIVWQYGTTGIPGSGLNELNNPTDAERLSNGNTLISDFSNHRVIEVRTSSYNPQCLGFEPYAIVWQYNCTRPADAERLSNGNTLIAVSGDNCVIEVVTPAIPAEELKPAAPFFISGFVNYMDGTPVTNSTVIITNENTSEVYIANTTADSHYYQALTCAYSAGAGTVLHFDVDDNKGNKTEFDHVVTTDELHNGGFEQNVTITYLHADLIVTRIDAYHNRTYYPKENYPPYFNLSNEVDVVVKNTGNELANASHVALYVDGALLGKEEVPGIGAGNETTVQFKWTPEGKDCEDGGTPVTYTLKAVADCDNEVEESDESNNELTAAETAYWAGYSADEELEEASHGVIRGGLLYTTGDGSYVGLYTHGSYKDTHYNIKLPADATVKHARLNVYYTWSRTKVYPVMEVSITNDATGETHTVPLAASYNDRPCESPAIAFEYPWGNYVYDLTPYIPGSGNYTVRVTNSGSAENPSSFCLAAPGLVILYEDSSMPEYEYWILEGADILEGGRRGGAGNLAWWECTNNATFNGTIDTSNVTNATLGMVSVWGGEAWGAWTSYYWFNDCYLGDGSILGGYSSLYNETIDGMSMYVGASGNAQVGANVSDVTAHIRSKDNFVSFIDDGDSMMPANAFLLVEYGAEIEANVTIEPEVLNLANEGEGVFTAFISLPEPYNVTAIDNSTVKCECAPAIEGVAADDKMFVARFDREDLKLCAIYGDEVELTVTGMLTTGEKFEGSDTICVIVD